MDEIRPVNGVVKDDHIKVLVKEYVMVVIATLIYAVSTYIFVLNSKFAPSGLSGILAMVEHLSNNLNTGTFTLLFLNIPLLILGFFMLSKHFAIKTALSVFILCGTLFLLELIDPEQKLRFIAPAESVGDIDFGKRFFCSIIGGIFAGISMAMSFKAQSSLGGTDILVMIIQNKRPHANISFLLTGFNMIVIVASIFVYKDVESICFAMIYIITFSKVCEYIMNGYKRALKFEVITEHPEELSKEIIEKLGHSVTLSKVKGMYANTDKYMLICVIRNRQVAAFEKILKNYPDTFAFTSPVNEVVGVFYK